MASSKLERAIEEEQEVVCQCIGQAVAQVCFSAGSLSLNVYLVPWCCFWPDKPPWVINVFWVSLYFITWGGI